MTTRTDTRINSEDEPIANVWETIYPTRFRKRDNTIVEYDHNKIGHAIYRALHDEGEGYSSTTMDSTQIKDQQVDVADCLARQISEQIVIENGDNPDFVPGIEYVQDMVEETLLKSSYSKTARHYILWRNSHAGRRTPSHVVSESTRQMVRMSKMYFQDNPLGEFIAWRTYARWRPDLGRRETWIEIVDRYCNYMQSKLGDKLSTDEYTEIREAILNQEVMPSMRMMQLAGAAVDANNVCAYNCP